MTAGTDLGRLEARALRIAMWGNLFMAAAGLVAGVLSNSTAILIDGLFSLIGFVSALMARRIAGRVSAGPDRLRPYGYAADESIFVTFRSLILLGLVFMAIAVAALNIIGYARGRPPAPLNFGPMLAYFAVIGATCFLLWFSNWRAWVRTGRKSDILRLEARAEAFDGLVTASAGVGLGAIYLLRDGPLGVLAPIGDSVIVIALCLGVVSQYLRGFRDGLAELAGVTAPPAVIATARRALRTTLAEDGGTLLDLSVLKTGRDHLVTLYYDPGRAMTAAEVDALNLRLLSEIQADLPGADVLVMPTTYGRSWPAAVDPRTRAAQPGG